MDAEEVDFPHLPGVFTDAELCRNGAYTGHEFARFAGADANMPFGTPARRFQSPRMRSQN